MRLIQEVLTGVENISPMKSSTGNIPRIWECTPDNGKEAIEANAGNQREDR